MKKKLEEFLPQLYPPQISQHSRVYRQTNQGTDIEKMFSKKVNLGSMQEGNLGHLYFRKAFCHHGPSRRRIILYALFPVLFFLTQIERFLV
jgi:hypothetical protein